MSLSTDGKLLVWETVEDFTKENIDCLNFPTKGYMLLIKKDGVVTGVGGLCFS